MCFFLCDTELTCQQQRVVFHDPFSGFDALDDQHFLQALITQLDAAGFKNTGFRLHVGPMLGAAQLHGVGGGQRGLAYALQGQLAHEVDVARGRLQLAGAARGLAVGGPAQHEFRRAIERAAQDLKRVSGVKRLDERREPGKGRMVRGSDGTRPAPELGAERLGFEPEDCVVFEDAAAGAEAAIAAGVGLVVGVSEKALDTEADIVVRDLVGITFDGDELVIPDKNRLR